MLGGWSSAAPGAQQARRILMEPLRDRVWFAGEAVHETAWGTVNGAWESGERAAEAALRKIGPLQEPEKPAPKKREPQRSNGNGGSSADRQRVIRARPRESGDPTAAAQARQAEYPRARETTGSGRAACRRCSW